MTQELELDPEVAADLQLRAASMRDSSRSRRAQSALGSDARSPAVTAWPCRFPRCGQLVDVPQEGVELLEQFNGYLRQRDEREIPNDMVMTCEEHMRAVLDERGKALHRKYDRLRAAIQRLKASPNPRAEHEVIRELERDHHPDISGLIESLASKLEGKTSKRTRRGDL